MKLKMINENATEINLLNGLKILFSYETPVAIRNADGAFYKTAVYYSKTTSTHINKWLTSYGVSPKDVRTIHQTRIDFYCDETMLPCEITIGNC